MAEDKTDVAFSLISKMIVGKWCEFKKKTVIFWEVFPERACTGDGQKRNQEIIGVNLSAFVTQQAGSFRSGRGKIAAKKAHNAQKIIGGAMTMGRVAL